MTHSFRFGRGALAKKSQTMSKQRKCLLEPLEKRELLTASGFVNGVGTEIEYSGPFSTFMPVGSGPNSYSGFSSFGVVEVPAASFGLNSGVSGVNNLSLKLYNSATSGKFAPTGGSFAVYFVPDDTTALADMRFGGPTGTKGGTQTDLAAIGTKSGDASTLGVSSSDLVGSFTISSSLPQGYSQFDFNSLSSAAKAGIANDINNGTNVRLIVVALDNNVKADWEGNFNNEFPQVQLDVNQAPLVTFSAPSYSVNEVDQNVGNTTVATITVHRSGNPNSSLDINYQTSDNTAHAPGDYIPASGVLHWDAGDTADKTFNVSFKDITTTDPSRSLNVSLSDHGGNLITPVFPANGTTVPVTINYKQAGQVFIDQSSYSVNETAGTVSIKVDRTGSNVNTATADIILATASGVPYLSDPQNPQDAQAGRDFGTAGNSTAPTYAIHFAAGQSQASVIVPLINVTTFAGTRSFTATLSDPSTGTQIATPANSTVTITDNVPANSQTPSGITTQSNGVETKGPYAGNTNNFMNLVSTPHAGFSFSTMPVLTFDNTSSVFAGGQISTVDSIKLSLYNLATTGSFAGTPGSFDVYVLTDDSVDDTSLVYGGGTGNTGPTVIGSQASPIFLGTANFTNNQVGYNDFTFDNLPAAVQSALTADYNSGTQFRFAITPSQGSPVAADWEGNYLVNQPELTLLTQTGSVVGTPPTVTGVVVDGTSWTTGALAALQTAGLGNGLGYSIPAGSGQLKPLPWGNVNQIQVQFSEDVNVSQSSLGISGVSGPYAVSGFSYNPTTFTGTWTLVSSLNTDRLSLVVHASGAGAVTSTADSQALDGEWTNSVSAFPSGDGTAGGDFNFGFTDLPGDANQDGIVNSQDIAVASSNWLHAGPSGDVNADGIINSQDLALMSSKWLAGLPAALAQASGAQSTGAQVASALATGQGNAASPASFIGPLSLDHLATFVGRVDSALLSGPTDRVFSQAGKTISAATVSDSVLPHASLSTATFADDLFTSSIDDELLSVIASGPQSGKKA